MPGSIDHAKKLVLCGCISVVWSLIMTARGQQPDLVVEAGHSGHVSYVAFGPDGRTVASGSEDSLVKLWDAETGKEIRTFAGHGEGITQISFSPDGTLLASAGTGIKLWDIATGKELRSFIGTEFTKDFTFSSVAFSPDGKVMAGVEAGDISLWDPSTGVLIHTLEQQRSASLWTSFDRVVFSPDGKRLASVNETVKDEKIQEQSISIWDTSTWQRPHSNRPSKGEDQDYYPA